MTRDGILTDYLFLFLFLFIFTLFESEFKKIDNDAVVVVDRPTEALLCHPEDTS